MRREGFEFALSRPEVVTRQVDGKLHEPVELLFVDVEEAHQGTVIDNASRRGGVMTDLVNHGSGRVKIEFNIPTKGLIGFRSEFLTETRGSGILHTSFIDFREAKGEAMRRARGVLIAKEAGDTTAYALEGLEDRGELFVGPGVKLYMGQIVGLHSRETDIVVNPCKKKHLTNMRSSTSDIAVKLAPPRLLSLEQSIEFINDDELVEVTPKSLRLRKKVLDHSQRKLEENRLEKVG
jgi:GTP-binding protein